MEGTKRSGRAAFGDAVEGGNANKVHKYDDSSDEDPDRQSSDDSGSDSNYGRFSKSFGTSASSSGSSASSDSSEGSSSSGSAASSSASDSDTSEEGWSTPQLASDAEDADAEDDLDVLIFLDFDDTLFPYVLPRISLRARWTP